MSNEGTNYKAFTASSSSYDTSSSAIIDMTPYSHQDNPDNPFAFTPKQLTSLVDRKDLSLLQQLQGVEGLARGLHSNLTCGIADQGNMTPSFCQVSKISSLYPDTPEKLMSASTSTSPPSLKQRQDIFGSNILPAMESNSLIRLMWIAFQDKTLILLSISAVISFSVGIYEDLTTVDLDVHGNLIPNVKWMEGAAILVAVLLVVVVGSVNDYQKEKQFRKLNAKKDDRHVNAIRSGQLCFLSIHDIQVGDVLSLEPGDIVAADGVFIQGHNVKCDESAATGESDAIRKASWQDCITARKSENGTQPLIAVDELQVVDTSNSHERRPCPDPFLVSGSKVLEGICTYLVTAVGCHSFHGRTLMSLRVKSEITPLQEKLNILAENIAKLGLSAAGFLFMVLSIRSVLAYLNADTTADPTEFVSQLTHILITTITVVVVAVPEGLPLAVTLALAYATQRMLKENNLVRILAACETMGNATTICSDKTGTLTQNRMAVVAGTFGSSFRFRKDPPVYRTDLVDLTNIRRRIPLAVRCFLNQAIAVNSTAFRLSNNDQGQMALVGNKTETAILNFSRLYLDSEPFECLRACWPVEQIYPFDSTVKAMGTVIRVTLNDTCGQSERVVYRLHIKGATEILLAKCSHLLSMHDRSYNTHLLCEENESGRYDIKTRTMTEHNYARLKKIIQTYGANSLRTIAICYRDYDTWPANWSLRDALRDGGLTMLGVVGIEDPLRHGVKQAVADCQNAGVCVRMVTGDNMMTAKSIARKCGIYQYGDLAMDGATFRKLSPELRSNLLPHLRVLARSSPEDKRLLVQALKMHGEIVAVTGDGTNDGPALKAADVGFSMQSGTEVANEASSIILMDDNFSSIVRAISWGRCVNDSVKKFLQFQLTVNVTAVLLTIVSSLTSSEQKSILTAVQLLWVNLIMDTFAALALATDPPTPTVLCRQPESRSAPLISASMWKMIIGQTVYQLAVMSSLLYTNVLQLDDSVVLQTIVFTAFVFCQIFNELNCRRIDNELNILKGITKNRFFMVIFGICVVGQILIVQYGGTAFQTCALNRSQWILCILLGFFSIPVGMIIRCLPDHLITPSYQGHTMSRSIQSTTAYFHQAHGGRVSVSSTQFDCKEDLMTLNGTISTDSSDN